MLLLYDYASLNVKIKSVFLFSLAILDVIIVSHSQSHTCVSVKLSSVWDEN